MASSADQSVLTLCNDVWQWRLSESPELATFCGFYQYDHLWDDISEEAYIRREKKVQEFLKAAEALNVAECDLEVALSHRMLVCDLHLYLKGTAMKSYLVPLNFLEGIHVDCNLTVSFMSFKQPSDFHNLKARLDSLPDRISQVISVLKKGMEEGIVNAIQSMVGIPKQIETILNTPVSDWGLTKPFKEKPEAVSSQEFDKLKTECYDIVQSKIMPAFTKLKTFILNEYIPNVRPQPGVSTLPDGDNWYQRCLDFHITASMTPQQIHDKGLSEVKRINAEMVRLAAEESLPQTMPALLKAIEERQADSFKSQEELLKYVQDLCYKKIRPKISDYFKELPDIRMTIQLSPAYNASAPAGYYLNGTPDGSRDGVYFINGNDLKNNLPFLLTALSLHEGEPGHHLQGIYQLSSSHLPDFRRYSEDSKYYLAPSKFSFNTGYTEGWGLYCEALGEEMGLYTTNLDLLGRYSMEIFRAARLVVDTGLHCFGWSKERAVDFLVEHILETRESIEKEVDRYITWPGQACAYKIGEIKIWELRRKAESKLGSKFDIKEFHHQVLNCGAVPLSVLEEVVDNFISKSEGL